MKVYVCICEDENAYTWKVTDVFESLEKAQEKMRVKFACYLERNPSINDGIKWFSGLKGDWGWCDTCSANGFYIHEKEVK